MPLSPIWVVERKCACCTGVQGWLPVEVKGATFFLDNQSAAAPKHPLDLPLPLIDNVTNIIPLCQFSPNIPDIFQKLAGDVKQRDWLVACGAHRVRIFVVDVFEKLQL